MRYSLLFFWLVAPLAFAFKEHPLDLLLIKNEPIFRHFAVSMNSRDLSVQDLLASKWMSPARAPNPKSLLEAMHTSNSKKMADLSTPFSVMSFNVALLNAKILRVISVVKSPYNKERIQLLPKLVFEQGFDAITLQEVWGEHRAAFEKAAESYGYQSFYGKNRSYEDGLATFVKKRWLSNPASIHLRWMPYEEQDPIEYFPGADNKRGLLHLEFSNIPLGTVHIYNTHLQSFRKYWRKRNYQARELGLDIARHVDENAVAIVGGDLNTTPYFRDDVWVKPDGSASKHWWKNTIAYAALLYYGGLEDAMVMGLPADLATIDITLADMVKSGAPNCSIPHLSFTATDCNSLNFMQYEGKEPPSRQDHLLVRDRSRRTKIVNRGLMFTEKMDFGNDLMIEPSDHYAIFINAQISR